MQKLQPVFPVFPNTGWLKGQRFVAVWFLRASLCPPDILASAWQIRIVGERKICLAAQGCCCSAGLVAVNYLALVIVNPTLHIPATSPAPGDCLHCDFCFQPNSWWRWQIHCVLLLISVYWILINQSQVLCPLVLWGPLEVQVVSSQRTCSHQPGGEIQIVDKPVPLGILTFPWSHNDFFFFILIARTGLLHFLDVEHIVPGEEIPGKG